MEKSIIERVREAMEEFAKNSRVPTKEEREYAVYKNRDERNRDLCYRIAEDYALRRKSTPDDLRAINALMEKK